MVHHITKEDHVCILGRFRFLVYSFIESRDVSVHFCFSRQADDNVYEDMSCQDIE